MFDYDTRATWKFLAWVFGIIVVIYISAIFLMGFATRPYRVAAKTVSDIAVQKTPIKRVNNTYHLSRDVLSYAVRGENSKKQEAYVIYLPKTKKAYYYLAKKGYNETKIRQRFESLHPSQSIVQINLGWYKNKAVWEVAFNNGKKLGYALFNFNNGKEISYIANL